jgi:sterol 3beta-glucosyltransferase
MFSSIHTIHRPVARSKRHVLPPFFHAPAHAQGASGETDEPGSPAAPDDDFEADGASASASAELPVDPQRSAHDALALIMDPAGAAPGGEAPRRNAKTHTGNMATVRMKRRAGLADKLRDVFELPGITEVIAGESRRGPCRIRR